MFLKLLEKQGQYYRLWEMQQGNFKVEEERKTEETVPDAEDEEEMTYVEGGLNISRTVAAMVLDGFLMLTPLGGAFALFKYLGSAAGKALIRKYAGNLAGKLGACVAKLGGMAGSFAVNFTASKILGIIDTICSCATSLGGIVAVAIDCVDKDGLSGRIKF